MVSFGASWASIFAKLMTSAKYVGGFSVIEKLSCLRTTSTHIEIVTEDKYDINVIRFRFSRDVTSEND